MGYPSTVRQGKAVGTDKGRQRRIAVGFTYDQWDAIQRIAEKNGVSMGEAIRRLCAKAGAA